MAVALRMHPDTERILIDFQKKLISENNMNTIEIFPLFPLFAELKNNYFADEDLKSIKKKILEINITGTKSEIIENKLFFYFDFEIKTDFEKIINEKLYYAFSKNIQKSNLLPQFEEKKIRITEIIDFYKENYETVINNSVWWKK